MHNFERQMKTEKNILLGGLKIEDSVDEVV